MQSDHSLLDELIDGSWWNRRIFFVFCNVPQHYIGDMWAELWHVSLSQIDQLKVQRDILPELRVSCSPQGLDDQQWCLTKARLDNLSDDYWENKPEESKIVSENWQQSKWKEAKGDSDYTLSVFGIIVLLEKVNTDTSIQKWPEENNNTRTHMFI